MATWGDVWEGRAASLHLAGEEATAVKASVTIHAHLMYVRLLLGTL